MNLFENLQSMKESSKVLLERDGLTPSEYNKLKTALNKDNSMRNNFILHPGSVVKTGNYILKIYVNGAFRNYEKSNTLYNKPDVTYADASKSGRGVQLYIIYVNLIDETIEFKDVYDSYYLERYVSHYEQYLINNGELNAHEIDVKTLINSIEDVAEKSKSNVTNMLKSKNFIYKLSGKGKTGHENDTNYNLNLDESSKLIEDFDPSMPNWLKVAIKSRNNDIYSNRKDLNYNYNLDTLKWIVEPFPEKGKLGNIANNEIYALLIDKSGDKHTGNYVVYVPALYIGNNETIEINGRNRNIETMSLRALAPYVKEFAHAVDSKQARQDIIDKQQDRASSKNGSINRKRADDDSLYDLKNLDKSGYIVDPNKYKRLLAKNNASKYSERLEDLYVVLNDCKEKLILFATNNLPDAKAPGYYNTSGKRETIKRCIDIYGLACGHYSDATDSLKTIASGAKGTWHGEGFTYFEEKVKACEMKVAELLMIIDKVEEQ